MRKNMQKITPPREQVTWHSISVEDALEKLQSSAKGLSPEGVKKSLAIHGANLLPQAPRRSPFLRFLLQFHNILIYVLMGSAFITALLGHWIDTGVILAVVIANALIGFIQEGKAEQAMNAIRHMLAPRANVIRDGERITVDGEQLVPGDIVLLEAGDKVPADLRLLSAHSTSVQEAILTGESVPVEKDVQQVAENSPLGDRSCMAFSGTLITSGQCKGVVVATGTNTEIGRISGLLSEVETLTTPLVAQMGVFAKWLTLL
ncbi:MAG: HAD-IC family P-type ATPase, partial [Pseudomonadales bacterium]